MAMTALKGRPKICRANFKTIEAELYNYKLTKAELKDDAAAALEDIYESAYYSRQAPFIMGQPKMKQNPDDALIDPALIRAQHISDPTFEKTDEVLKLRRRLAQQYREVFRRLEAIEWMLNHLRMDPEPKKRELVELKYFEHKLSDREIAKKLHISMATFRRWRRYAIELVAMRLGWMV